MTGTASKTCWRSERLAVMPAGRNSMDHAYQPGRGRRSPAAPG